MVRAGVPSSRTMGTASERVVAGRTALELRRLGSRLDRRRPRQGAEDDGAAESPILNAPGLAANREGLPSRVAVVTSWSAEPTLSYPVQYKATPHHATRCNTMHYCTVACHTTRPHHTMACHVTPHNTIPFRAILYRTILYRTGRLEMITGVPPCSLKAATQQQVAAYLKP